MDQHDCDHDIKTLCSTAGGGIPRMPADELGAAEPAAGTAVLAAAANTKLDSLGNNRTPGSALCVTLRPCHCRCRTCPLCGPVLAWRTRQAILLRASNSLRIPAMLTLTVDRKEFPSPQQAHQFISEKGRLRLLLRRLGVDSYFWVLEFQQSTGGGWPHWHILFDLADCPGQKIDLDKAWTCWRRRWNIGGLHFQPLRRGFNDTKHAVFYITKYLGKQPSKGFPLWVLESRKRIRLCQASQNFGAIAMAERERKATAVQVLPNGKMRRGRMRPLLNRMAKCQQTSNAYLEYAGEAAGDAIYSYVGSLPINYDHLALLVWQRIFDCRLIATIVPGRGRKSAEEIRLELPASGIADAKHQLRMLQESLQKAGKLAESRKAVEIREAMIRTRAERFDPQAEGGSSA